MPSYEITFEASPELARQAALYLIWRTVGRRIIVLCLLMLLLVVFVVQNQSYWYLFVLLGVGLNRISTWISYYRKADISFQTMSDRTINICFDDEGLVSKHLYSTRSVQWAAPFRIWKFRKLWSISCLDTRVATVIPTEVMSKELQEFIEKKVLENGGVVV